MHGSETGLSMNDFVRTVRFESVTDEFHSYFPVQCPEYSPPHNSTKINRMKEIMYIQNTIIEVGIGIAIPA